MQRKSATIIILSGGTSVRFGSDKSKALINGQSLIAWILNSIPSQFEVIVVGDDPKMSGIDYQCVRENPIGGGPVAGFQAGLKLCTSDMTALVAVDMPLAVPSVIKLFSEISVDDDAVMYIDADGFKQPLAAVYRVESVRGVLAHAGNVDGKSMRELVSQLNVREVHLSQEISPELIDIDTQLDLDRAITTLASREGNL